MTKKNCFVIAPIGEPNSETRKRSDQILRHVIDPAVTSCGYDAIRADQISEPGMITSQVIQHIVDDPLVIADLTERNPNVFYELAIRHVIRKPLVQLIKRGEQIPFDVAGARTIHVDHQDLDSVEEAKGEIVRQIHSVNDASSPMETPISVSLDLQTLKQSENPEQRSLADILSVISELRTSVGRLEKRLDNPETLIPFHHFLPFVDEVISRSSNSRNLGIEVEQLLNDLTLTLQSDFPEVLGARPDIGERLSRLGHGVGRRPTLGNRQARRQF